MSHKTPNGFVRRGELASKAEAQEAIGNAIHDRGIANNRFLKPITLKWIVLDRSGKVTTEDLGTKEEQKLGSEKKVVLAYGALVKLILAEPGMFGTATFVKVTAEELRLVQFFRAN